VTGERNYGFPFPPLLLKLPKFMSLRLQRPGKGRDERSGKVDYKRLEEEEDNREGKG
jgi:hypothetical protein